MRIRRLTVKNFGKFENYAVDFNGNLAIVNGQNEAGKSTIFDMIKVLLFGLGDDVSPEVRLSYIRYGANEAHISGEFERADGTPITLSRIITENSSDLNVNENFDFKNMGSIKAPMVSDLSKEVYENIYALDFHAMSAIKDDIWQGIKEEFMDADMASELVSANEAIVKSRQGADELYKNESSPSVINELLKERDGLKEKLSEVNQSQKAAAEDYLNLDKAKREITDLQNKIEFERAFITEANKMNGLKDDVTRVKTLANEAGDLSPYKAWLPNLKENYEYLKQQKKDALDEIETAKTAAVPKQKEPVPKMPENYFVALSHKEEIRALSYTEPQEPETVEEEPATPPEEEFIQPQEQSFEAPAVINEPKSSDEYLKASEEWEKVCSNVLSDKPDDEEIYRSLDQINSMNLAEKLELYTESKENLNNMIRESTQQVGSPLRTAAFVFSVILSVAMILTGVAIFVFEWLNSLLADIPALQQGLSTYIGLFGKLPVSEMIVADLLCGLGLILLIVAFAFIKEQSQKTVSRNRDQIIRKAREESEYNRVEFEKQLYGLPITRIKIKNADPTIAGDIMRLKQARQNLFEAKNAEPVIEQAVKAPEPPKPQPVEEKPQTAAEAVKTEPEINPNEDIESLAKVIFGYTSGDALQDLDDLNSLLDDALYMQENIERIERKNQEEEPVPEVDLTQLEQKLQQADYKLREMEAVLGDNPDEEIETLQERYNKLNKAVVLRDEILEKHPNFKELSERLNHLSKAGWPYTEDAVSSAKSRIEEMRDKIGQEQTKIGAMENSVKKAILGHNPAEIASQILKLDDRIINYKAEYDKLRISENIIKEGHDTFSKLHQPEVLQRASYYLSILTEGKYSELDLDGETSEITVMLQDGRYMTPQAARLSQATREQIYLSIRLSVIESFDEEKEVMPITLDEALITWDKERLTAGLDLLAQIAKKRQILIFTCHDFIVNTMKENQPSAQIIDLK